MANKYAKVKKEIQNYISYPFIATLSVYIQLLIGRLAITDPDDLNLNIFRNFGYIGWIFIGFTIITVVHAVAMRIFPYYNKKWQEGMFSIAIFLPFSPLFFALCIYPFPMVSGPFYSLYLLLPCNMFVAISQIITFVAWLIYPHVCPGPKTRLGLALLSDLFPVFGIIGTAMLFKYYDLFDIEGYSYPSFAVCSSVLVYLLIGAVILFDEKILYAFIPFKKYILFLRSFQNDMDLNENLKLKFKLPIIEVADPTSSKGNIKFNGYDFFLPSNKWQSSLKYYIDRAVMVIVNLGVTDGVQWEMFEYENNRNKYVFISKNIETFDIDAIKVEYKNDKLIDIIQQVKAIYGVGEIAFCFSDNYCYCFNKIEVLCKCKLNGNFPQNIKKFELPYDENKPIPKHFLLKWKITDLYRLFWRMLRPVSIFKILAFPFASLLYALVIIFPIVMIIGGILLLGEAVLYFVGVDVMLDESPGNLIWIGALMIILGIGLLQQVFE